MEISSGKELCPKVQADKMTLKRSDGKRGNLTPQAKPCLGCTLVWGREGGRLLYIFIIFTCFSFSSGVSSWAGCNMKKEP